MNILILGSEGQVGWELVRSLLALGNVKALNRQGADLADPDALRMTVRSYGPDLIINAAAYTVVDKAEGEEAAAMAVNATAPGVLAEEAKRIGAMLIHYSTDYVFDGLSGQPYTETDLPAPQSVYGRSKLAGEQAVMAAGCDSLILRASWVYGVRGHNFMRTILRLAREREHLRIVSDQTGAPTWSRWIADATAHVARQAAQRREEGRFASGIYHLTCAGAATWHEFAVEIVARYRELRPESALAVQTITPISTSEYPTPARRPANSRLDGARLAKDYGIVAPDWREALNLCLQDMPQSLLS